MEKFTQKNNLIYYILLDQTVVNFTSSHELNHCRFHKYLSELEPEYLDLSYYQKFDGLVVIKVCDIFFFLSSRPILKFYYEFYKLDFAANLIVS